MAEKMKSGTILIMENAVLPKTLQLDSEPLRLAGSWSRISMGTDWIERSGKRGGVLCLAGEIKTIALGISGPKMLRRGIERILANPRSETFNSLEIMRVVSKRFLGVRYVSVGAQSRHIQESLFLSRTKGIPRPEARKASQGEDSPLYRSRVCSCLMEMTNENDAKHRDLRCLDIALLFVGLRAGPF